MALERVSITSPVGRIVAGSLYKPNTTDFDGNPLVYKSGKDIGKPRVQYFFSIAIPKAGEPHWAHTEWGAKIWAVGHQAFPQAAQRPDFAWKVDDGDSPIPNKRNNKPCDQEGYPGHWILKLSNGYAPTIYKQEGNGWVQLTEPGVVKAGHFVQVAFEVDGNGNQNNSGVYLNPGMVCFRAYGPEINFGPSVEEAGFGAAPLPVGASLTPPPATTMPAASAAAYSPSPAPAGAYPSPPPPPAGAPPPVPVYPQPGFVQMPPNPGLPANGPGAPPPAVGAIPAPPAPASLSRQMTAKAGAVTYQAYVAAGWTDAQLIANGLMTA